MKVLFTADWHIKLGQKNVPVSWAENRYIEFFYGLADIEPGYDLHIIGGDIFDRLPSLEELAIFFLYVRNVSDCDVIIYDGNHEATKKHHTFLSSISDIVQAINPKVKIVTSTYITDNFSILPYCDLKKRGVFDNIPTDRPLFTHVRGEIPPHVHPEIDLDLLSPFPVVFAGDLHSHSNTQRNIVYPGSPLTTEFHRNKVKTGYISIELPSGEWEWHDTFSDMPQLIRKTVSDPAEMIPTKRDHTIYEIQGDLQELSQIENSELLDKKVVKRSTETSLVLGSGMTIQQELDEYLKYILEIADDKCERIMKTYNDYAKKINME